MLRITIGKRFAMLRDELKGDEPWTQSKVANSTGLTTNQVARLEQSGAGSIDGFLTMLIFYQSQGYNLNWILLEDNEQVGKLFINENTKNLDTQGSIAALQALKSSLTDTLSIELDKIVEKLTP